MIFYLIDMGDTLPVLATTGGTWPATVKPEFGEGNDIAVESAKKT